MSHSVNKPARYIKHTEIADNNFTLGVVQEKNWHYFIKRLLEACNNLELVNIVAGENPEEVKIINVSLQNLAICKELYKILYNSVADNYASILIIFLKRN